MGAAIGQFLPIAVGVLISPLPVVAVVLMLVSGKAKANALAFLLAWFVSVAAIVTVVAILVGGAAGDAASRPAWVAWVKIALGALLLLLAGSQWRGRPRQGATPETPKWMTVIDAFTPVKAAGLAFVLGAVNPKNLLLVVSGGAAISAAAQGTSTRLVAALVFAVIATLGVTAPFVIYLAMGTRAHTILDALKTWMIQHNAIIMTVLLLIISAKMIGDGVSAL
ncbi:hypothetical protein BAY61_13875 [Prauserella marina]|uniref:Sap, sulfolipid-1-addressing protein n=1 Tax=Prauserella marina TaxID=530584 RepID=A0A222VQ95_9PSEU|nr:GAP family protein [Prauserella marina]ASR35913.1 hypothetical protein BAY61_13875 [Prauserella marina]PWV84161.1 Sap-like sulfolipid-1-addressing protein [Prauserella marina]SDC29039.1 Sap, sulfolipid-1-addressing protein [Prauserella marina]